MKKAKLAEAREINAGFLGAAGVVVGTDCAGDLEFSGRVVHRH